MESKTWVRYWSCHGLSESWSPEGCTSILWILFRLCEEPLQLLALLQDQLLGLLLEAIEAGSLLLQLFHLGQELLKASVVILLLLPIKALLDHSLVDGSGWIFRIIEVSDEGILLERPVYFLSDVKTTIGASGPKTKVVELVQIPDPRHGIVTFAFRIYGGVHILDSESRCL